MTADSIATVQSEVTAAFAAEGTPNRAKYLPTWSNILFAVGMNDLDAAAACLPPTNGGEYLSVAAIPKVSNILVAAKLLP